MSELRRRAGATADDVAAPTEDVRGLSGRGGRRGSLAGSAGPPVAKLLGDHDRRRP
jgi:hypothetical protein